MNNKGFTLVELIATIVILALVMGIASYAITGLITSSKQKNYDLLVTSVKDAAESYYNEYKYYKNEVCATPVGGTYTVTLGDLVNVGHLKGNSKDENDKYTIINPMNDESIAECEISISYSDGKVKVDAIDPSGSCPTNYN